MKELGEYLKETREENHVSISEVAEDLNMSVNIIENIEIGNWINCRITDVAQYDLIGEKINYKATTFSLIRERAKY